MFSHPCINSLTLSFSPSFPRDSDRQMWSAYLTSKNIPFVFFSAHIAAEQEEEAARLAEAEEAKSVLTTAGIKLSPRFARQHREAMEKHNAELEKKRELTNAQLLRDQQTDEHDEEQKTETEEKAEKEEMPESAEKAEKAEAAANTGDEAEESAEKTTSAEAEQQKGEAAETEESAIPAAHSSASTTADMQASVASAASAVSEESTRVLSRDELIDYLLNRYLSLVVEPKKGSGTRQLMVGMVGYPNVGKSSTINVIYGTKKTTVSSTPGKTKHFQTLRVDLDETPHESDQFELWLCDCPGLVFPSLVSTKAHMVVNGLLPIDTLREYRGPISLLCTRIPRWMWLDSYGLRLPPPPDHLPVTDPPSVEELLQGYGTLRGFMNSHGTADAGRSARTLLKDYVDGLKLLYCAPTPPIAESDSRALTPAQCMKRAKGVCVCMCVCRCVCAGVCVCARACLLLCVNFSPLRVVSIVRGSVRVSCVLSCEVCVCDSTSLYRSTFASCVLLHPVSPLWKIFGYMSTVVVL
jgi:ribosome biogenesis GTPase A